MSVLFIFIKASFDSECRILYLCKYVLITIRCIVTIILSLEFPGTQESVENQTGVAVGSAVGIVTLIIITLVLVIFLRRRYTFTCIISNV